MNGFIQLAIEGDELYTKVNNNEQPSASQGWTVLIMERDSQFIWTLKRGKKTAEIIFRSSDNSC